jgi:catechol 2,3-dioxygenase-like lactoylglutathione lyase family enzyme
MRRFHVHISVQDIQQSVGFYSALFGCPPTVVKDDYAKWMLDDPRVNFAISRRSSAVGINHLGLQFDSDRELEAHRAQISALQQPLRDEHAAPCCYSESDKHWINDPQGIAWEAFHTLRDIPMYGNDTGPKTPSIARRVIPIQAAAPVKCCAPSAPPSQTK